MGDNNATSSKGSAVGDNNAKPESDSTVTPKAKSNQAAAPGPTAFGKNFKSLFSAICDQAAGDGDEAGRLAGLPEGWRMKYFTRGRGHAEIRICEPGRQDLRSGVGLATRLAELGLALPEALL